MKRTAVLALIALITPPIFAGPAIRELNSLAPQQTAPAASLAAPVTAPDLTPVEKRPFLQSLQVLLLKAPGGFSKRDLTLYPGRDLPLFEGRNKFGYAFRLQQDRTAPLVFVSAGTGGTATDTLTLFLGDLAYRAGYSVVTLPSTTHWSFALAAARKARAGYLPDDAQDLYKALLEIRGRLALEEKAEPRAFALAGYSYGALDASFLAAEDLAQKRFNFSFVLAVNPPLSRAAAIAKVDKYYAMGAKWTPAQREALLSYATGKYLELTGENPPGGPVKSLEDLAARLKLDEGHLAWLMAQGFYSTLNDSAFVARQLADGDLDWNDIPGSIPGSLATYLGDTVLAGAAQDHGIAPAAIARDSELSSLFARFPRLNSPEKYLLFHSMNDFLSFPEGKGVLAAMRAEKHLYPFGGHMGILADLGVTRDLVSTLADRLDD